MKFSLMSEESNFSLSGELITLEDVSRVYRLGEERIVALHQINLEVSESEFVVVQGPSGSGKRSTLN